METKTRRKVTLAKEVGFCFGVKRAINLTRQALAERSENVFILGDLVHNKQVTDELEAKGLHKVDELGEGRQGTLIIRAHGLPKAKLQECKDSGLEIVNATCPIVMRAQEAAKSLEDRGCQVVVIGDRNHAEVKGIIGALDGPALVVDSKGELHEARAKGLLRRKVGVIFQTTHALELCYDLVNELVSLCKEIQIINTICRPVQNRQDDALDLAEKVDLMLVVGSITSANTMELAALCRHHNPYTLQIADANDLNTEDFEWATHIGIASGLSTPEDLVEAIKVKILTFEGAIVPEKRPAPERYVAGQHGGH